MLIFGAKYVNPALPLLANARASVEITEANLLIRVLCMQAKLNVRYNKFVDNKKRNARVWWTGIYKCGNEDW